MRVVSPLLKTVVYPALSSVGAFHRIASTGLAVVTYHGIIPDDYNPVDAAFDGNLIRAETLRRQIRFLKGKYNIVSPEAAFSFFASGEKLPSRAVLLTCDDGLLNCLTDMLPVLTEEKVQCLFFVTGASASETRSTLWHEELFLIFLRAPSGPFSAACQGILIEEKLEGREQRRGAWWRWVQRLSQLDSERRSSVVKQLRDYFGLCESSAVGLPDSAICRRSGLMIRDELRKLQSAGMTIGAHSCSHPMLSQQQPELAYEEISRSREVLGAALSTDVWAFAYPFGDPPSITPRICDMAEKAGYTAAFVNFGGGLGRKLPAYACPRIHVTKGMTFGEFEAHVCGFYERMQQFRSIPRTAEVLSEAS
jgi:peptidoglycan/xylan/chitin deacetylase (PgdA/CDA1 family)